MRMMCDFEYDNGRSRCTGGSRNDVGGDDGVDRTGSNDVSPSTFDESGLGIWRTRSQKKKDPDACSL